MASKVLQAKLTQLEEAKEELLVRIAEEKLEKPKISEEFMTFWLHRNIKRCKGSHLLKWFGFGLLRCTK